MHSGQMSHCQGQIKLRILAGGLMSTQSCILLFRPLFMCDPPYLRFKVQPQGMVYLLKAWGWAWQIGFEISCCEEV